MEIPLNFYVITAIKKSASLIIDDDWWGLAWRYVYKICYTHPDKEHLFISSKCWKDPGRGMGKICSSFARG